MLEHELLGVFEVNLRMNSLCCIMDSAWENLANILSNYFSISSHKVSNLNSYWRLCSTLHQDKSFYSLTQCICYIFNLENSSTDFVFFPRLAPTTIFGFAGHPDDLFSIFTSLWASVLGCLGSSLPSASRFMCSTSASVLWETVSSRCTSSTMKVC